MAINNPVLYWRDSSSKSPLTLEQLIADTSKQDQVIQFESGTDPNSNMIEAIEYLSDENTVNEPEITTGQKTINKQNVGALPEGITVRGHVDISQTAIVTKIRSFARKVQVIQSDFEFGIFGFYSNVSTFFDVDPSDTIGYTLKFPRVGYTAPKKQLDFSFQLLLGGRNLT